MSEQVITYRAVSERLLSAIAFQSVTHAAYEAASDAHDDKRRTLVLDGIPGFRDRSPSDLREAALRRALVLMWRRSGPPASSCEPAMPSWRAPRSRNVWSAKRCARCTLLPLPSKPLQI